MLYVQQPSILRIACAVVAASAVVLPALSGAAAAQMASSPCYELIPARAGIEPPAPMLVDKCSGRSWLLVRAGRGVYRWAALGMEAEKPKAIDRPATDAKPSEKAGKEEGGGKCFTFNNRRFCE